MANDASLIFFRSHHGVGLSSAACALTERGLSVTRRAEELMVRDRSGPTLRIVYVRENYVGEEAAEISEGTPHGKGMSPCDARFEILIDDLEALLDEINTLIEVQATLQDATRGFLFNTWNGELSGPD